MTSKSRYDGISKSIKSTIPKKALRHSWSSVPETRPNIVIRSYEDPVIIPDQTTFVKEQKKFFEQKLEESPSASENPKPQPNKQTKIPYRVKRFTDSIGTAPRRPRRTLTDFPQWKNYETDVNPKSRRHTVQVTREALQLLDSSACLAREGSRRVSSDTSDRSFDFDSKEVSASDAVCSDGMGVPSGDSVPRVVGASVKFINGIPEDFLDRLPESSVDPSPDEKRKSSDWRDMRASRDALLQQGLSGPTVSSTDNVVTDDTTKANSPSIRTIQVKPDHATPVNIRLEPPRDTLQKELADAGVFFRNPEDPSVSEVNEALETLDASLAGIADDTVSPHRTPVHDSPSSSEDVISSDKKTIIRIHGAKSDTMEPKSSASENFNLIEEVLVTSRTKLIPPPSTVEMKAYYPSFTVDTDSGHESGATSPCDTSSPPPSPGVPKTQPIPERPPNHTQSPPNMECASPGVIKHSEVTVVQMEPSLNSHFVVVAIDFGTTYSGYAFSFTQDPENIHVMKKWEGGDPGIINQKTPTIVLLNPDLEFHSMGFTARDTFHDLDTKEAKNWHYFDKFKMELHSNQVLTKESTLEASNGRKVPALDIFTHALRYFRNQAVKELSDQTGMNIDDDDVRWVITVPAIWSYPAKQFMRTAAYKAGMSSPEKQDHLLIALEPEAAAIYCRRLRRNQLLPEIPPEQRTATLPMRKVSAGERHSMLIKDSECPSTPDLERGSRHSLPCINSMKIDDWLYPGTVYMVVDCGGGTVDITVHQMTNHKSGHLKEIHKATGGPYGSTGVDQEFRKLLNVVFGEDFMVDFKKQRPVAYVDMMIAFESRKRNASPKKTSPLNIALPFSFIDLYKRTKGKDVDSAIKKHQHLGIKWSSQGMLRVEQDTMRQLFLPTMDKIREAIEGALSSPEVTNLQYMFLVGGFCESELLQQYLRDAFGKRVSVIIPQGMSLAILRGAVQFGLDPSVVTVRRSRQTYGVGVLNKFKYDVHPQEKKVFSAGEEWCADILDKFVVVDQSVAIGDVVTRSYTPAVESQREVILHMYATEREDAQFVTDEGVRKVGTLHLSLGSVLDSEESSQKKKKTQICGKPIRREITVHLRFGGTEVKASAVDHATGQCVRANFEFATV